MIPRHAIAKIEEMLVKRIPEIWKVVPGFEKYEASNLGNIRLRKRLKNGKPRKNLTTKPRKDGYIRPTVYRNDGTKDEQAAHRMVILAFLENPLNLQTVNHKDEFKHHNWIWNLEWMSQSDQNKKANKTIVKRSGTPVNRYDTDGNFLDTWEKMEIAAIHFLIPSSNISRCCSGELKTAGGFVWEKRIEKIEGEIWRLYHPNYPGVSVSNKGRVKTRKGPFTYGTVTGSDYRRVKVYNAKLDKYQCLRVHRMVALTFKFSAYEKGLVVNHINGKKYDNDVENLEWCTVAENNEHSIEMRDGINDDHRSKKVVRINLETGKIIKEYSSVHQAWVKTKKYGFSYNCIRTYCEEKSTTRVGSQWRYLSDF